MAESITFNITDISSLITLHVIRFIHYQHMVRLTTISVSQAMYYWVV
jgi:hypothetical protein